MASYCEWQHDRHLSPIELARLGFYCSTVPNSDDGNNWAIRCFSCGLTIRELIPLSEIDSRHQTMDCAYRRRVELNRESLLSRMPRGRVFLFDGSPSASMVTATVRIWLGNEELLGNMDVDDASVNNPGSYEDDYDDDDDSNDATTSTLLPPSSSNRCHDRGSTVPAPKWSIFSTYESRLNSFVSWPKSIPVTAASLAEAGFFYHDRNDTVTCFHCGYRLNGWDSDSVPWKEHACIGTDMRCSQFSVSELRRFYHPPHREIVNACHYVMLTKGYQFVLDARKHEDESPDENEHEEKKMEKEPVKSLEQMIMMDEESIEEKHPPNCTICCEEIANILFYPCGHIVSCYKCAAGHLNCFICRSKISDFVKAYFV